MIIYISIYLHGLLPNCVLLLHAAHTIGVSVLYVNVVFDDKHVLNLMCVRACMCLPQIKLIFACIYIFFNAHYRLVSRFTDVHFNMVCKNVHALNIL